MAKTMRAVQVPAAGKAFELVERPIPDPGRGQVRIKVEACGICHSDQMIREGVFPGTPYPRVPGHEVAGKIDALGAGVSGWSEGDDVGVGWHGGHCFQCGPCRRGEFVHCEKGQVTGLSHDGGYADYMITPQEALARRPLGLTATEAAPLCCAGITVFNALRHAGAMPGSTVAVLGIGGLGHLAVQYAAKLGFRVAAVSGSADKQNLAASLGAHHYIDASRENPGEALQRLGGASVILATAPSRAAMEAAIGGLGVRGKLIILGVAEGDLAVAPLHLLMGSRAVAGWASGSAIDSEDTMNFSALADVRPMIETFPIEQAEDAYHRMIRNEARFRVVLTMS